MSATIEFFFDIGSPYSYLAATQMEALGARTGAEIRWRPFLLGGVFKAVGNRPPAALAEKGSWMLGDLARWAAHYGVPFAMSSHFPVNSLLPMRALTALEAREPSRVPALALALYRDYWVDDVDVSTAEAVADAAVRVGLEAAPLLEGAVAQATKDCLRETTEEAIARGAFGAPTFFVGDAMFWGNDCLHFVEAEVADGGEA